jgi:hypothetical protein
MQCFLRAQQKISRFPSQKDRMTIKSQQMPLICTTDSCHEKKDERSNELPQTCLSHFGVLSNS